MSALIFLATIAFSSVSVQATTYFDSVGDWYQQGAPITYDGIRGFYSGRCFSADEKDIPRNTLLGYLELAPSRDPGPGFPQPLVERKINSVIWRGQAEGVFDRSEDYEFNRRSFESITQKVWATIGLPSDSPTLTFEVDWQADGSADLRSELVSYDSYYVARNTALKTQYYVNGWTGAEFRVRAGEVVNYCYYFKPLGF